MFLDITSIFGPEEKGEVDDRFILQELPPHLATEISLFINGDIVHKVPIFKNCPLGFIKLLVSFLKPLIFGPKDWVVKIGEAGNEMYFISKGEVEVIDSSKQVITILKEGDFFGEIVLLIETQRTASIRAKSYCDLFALSKKDLKTILLNFPDQKQYFRDIAQTRIASDLLRSLLHHEKLFRNCSNEFLSALVERFKNNSFSMGEYIYSATVDKELDTMYFVGLGSVELVSPSDRVMKTLTEGDFYGSMTIIHAISYFADLLSKTKPGPSNISLRAASTPCIVLYLSVKQFSKLLSQAPDQRDIIATVAKELATKMEGLPTPKIVDANISHSSALLAKGKMKMKVMSKFLDPRPVQRAASVASVGLTKKSKPQINAPKPSPWFTRLEELTSDKELDNLNFDELLSALGSLSKVQQQILNIASKKQHE